MKVLHITNELTKKNFSIASLIFFISKHLYKSYKFDYSILTSKAEKFLFDDKNINQIQLSNWISIFFKIKILSKNILNYDVIHIHGIWAPIQILSILICNLRKKNYVIHPHGMLLDEALKSTGFFKYIYKKIFLFFFRFLITNKTFFVSITDQEKNAIKKFFPNSKISQIYNPIPFETSVCKSHDKKKQFVYFGRIHPHKNIDLIIKAFKDAKLDEGWKLKIYGIHDDNKYLNKLTKLIGSDSRIKILEPIFGEQKQKVLNESWLNVLVSKSEVLSLSILESSIYGLPSLANKNIEVKQIEDSVLTSDTSIIDIKQKLELVSNWSQEERLQRGKNIFKNVEAITSIDKISLKYLDLYNNLEEEKNIFKTSEIKLLSENNFKFLLLTGTYMFNLMFSSLIVVALVVFGHYSIAGELGLVTSFWITITQIFSSNLRSIIVSENNIEYAFSTLFYRIFTSVIFYFFGYIVILNFVSFENKDLIILFSILILVQWINEMSLVKSEVKRKTLIFKIYSIVNFVTLLLSIFCLYFSLFGYLQYIFSTYILFIIASIFINYNKFNDLDFNINLKSIYQLNIRTIAFLSSFSIVISSFAWRIMIYYTFDKSLAGVFFACFSIGSFPGTVFNSVIGPAFIKQKIQLTNKFKNFLYVVFVLILIWFILNYFLIFDGNKINYLSLEFISFTVSISLIGSYFMSYAMYLRHKKLQSSSKVRSDLFQTDILYGTSITFLIPILYYSANIVGASFAFFVASLIALAVYSFNNKFQPYNSK